MNCKDCIYFKRCVVLGVELDMSHDKEADKNCRYFKNKSNVVEVLRCKDCKCWQREGQGTTYGTYGTCHSVQWDNDYFYYETFENDFCSYGERQCRE